MEFCISEIAANIAMDCSHPLVSGYTGRALLIPWSVGATFTASSSNPRIITAISLPASAKVVGVNNVMADPFNGSSKASSADSGFLRFTKTIALRVPARGAELSDEVIEPLLNSAEGFVAILEKVDKVGDGSYEIIGYQSPLKCNPDGLTQSESENGGCYVATMSCVENWAEVCLVATPTSTESVYEATKAAFEDLLDESY